MRRLFEILLVLIVLMCAGLCWAGDPVEPQRIITAETITAGSSFTSEKIVLSRYVGYFSLQVAVSGSGTAKFEYLLSNDGTNYLEPTSASDIATGVTATSGPGSDGKDIYMFYPEVASFMKIKVTETGGASSVTVTVDMGIQ